MAAFIISDPKTGQKIKLTGSSPPTEQELNDIFSGVRGGQNGAINNGNNADDLGATSNELSFSEKAIDTIGGVVEPLSAIAQGALVEPVAGLSGLAAAGIEAGRGIVTGEDTDPARAGAEVVESVRQSLSFEPKTESGKENLQLIGDKLAPIADAFQDVESGIGDAVFEKTGSPVLAAMATTIPTLATEILGISVARKGAKTAQQLKKSRADGQIARSIENALPSQAQLKDISRSLYKEIDDTGAVLKGGSVSNLVNRVNKSAETLGVDPDLTPDSNTVLKRFNDVRGEELTLSQVDSLRQKAQIAAQSITPKDAAIGSSIIDAIDEFLDKGVNPNSFSRAGDQSANIANKYKTARDLWGRARRSELLEDAFEKARLQASGFENGVRVQFRSILNNKKKRKSFNKEEITAMKRVVNGTAGENLAKLIGRFGFTEGSATNIVGGSLGIGAGATVAGPAGAVAVPLIGQVSRKLAQRMTVKNAEFADKVIRAGKDAKKITAAYMRNTPKAERSASELSELLTRKDIDLKLLKGDSFIKEAVILARRRRSDIAGATAATVGLEVLQEEAGQ